jgi:peptidoglycan/LPS O-acetylase OafA/YrhL
LTFAPTAAPSSAADLYAAFSESAYFPSLNGIRAICALMVIKIHVHWSFGGGSGMLDRGFLGVDMFFIISGFLIVTLLLREREASGRIDLKQFYIRRTLRIFPIYYLLVALLLLIALASYGHSSRTWDLYKWSFPVFLLYLQDFVPAFMGVLFHTWSLAMEEQFYLVWPSVEKFARRAWVVPLLLGLLLVNQLCNFDVFHDAIAALYGPEGPRRPVFLITFAPILLGVLAAHVMHHRRSGPALAALLGNRWMPPLLLALAMLVCQYTPTLRGLPYACVHLLFCLALLAMVINPRGVFSRTLQSRPLFYLGSISYGIYLYHTMIIWVFDRVCESRRLHPAAWVQFLVVATLAIAVAGISFKYLEAPIMRRRHRTPAAGSVTAPQRA